MEISAEKEQEIEDRIVEKVLRMIPDVIGNLITHHMTMQKTNQDFYTKHKDLQEHKDIVAKVLEQVEGDNPLLDHKDLMEKALPKIHEHIKLSSGLSMDAIDMPSIDYNGEL